MSARLKHFGWGREGEGLSADEEAFVLARAQARFGTTLAESASAPRLEEITLAAPRVTAPGRAPILHQRPLRPRRAHVRQVLSGSRARARARLHERAGCRRLSARRGGSRRRARLGRRRRRDGDAVRRRVERVRRRRAEAQRPQGRRHGRSAQPGKSEGGRQGLARRADRRRHLRPGAGGAVASARAHAAPLSAELRILDARRLDRDALGRAFCHALHAHRRSGRNRCAW